MNNLANFTINDPLDGQVVTIIVTLPTSDEVKDERPALVSIGVANQMPVIKTGVLGDLTNLIDDGWKAFGVQAEATKVAVTAQEEAEAAKAEKKAEMAVSPELIAEVEIETEETELAEAIEPAPVRPAPASKPASNLGLF